MKITEYTFSFIGAFITIKKSNRIFFFYYFFFINKIFCLALGYIHNGLNFHYYPAGVIAE